MSTIKELQAALPWGLHNYSEAFKANPVAHRDFAHAFLHIQKALGRIAPALDDADHMDNIYAAFAAYQPLDKYIADIIICALRMANTLPGGSMDVEAALEARIREIAVRAQPRIERDK